MKADNLRYAVFATGHYMHSKIKYLDAGYTIVVFSDNDPKNWYTEPLEDGENVSPLQN